MYRRIDISNAHCLGDGQCAASIYRTGKFDARPTSSDIFDILAQRLVVEWRLGIFGFERRGAAEAGVSAPHPRP